jgi:hypothetical protein
MRLTAFIRKGRRSDTLVVTDHLKVRMVEIQVPHQASHIRDALFKLRVPRSV